MISDSADGVVAAHVSTIVDLGVRMDRTTAAAYIAEGLCPLDDGRLVDYRRGNRGMHGTCPRCANYFLVRDGSFIHRVHGLPKVLVIYRSREVLRAISERAALTRPPLHRNPAGDVPRPDGEAHLP